MGKIFFDLDGPILDNRAKYYSIYKDLLKDNADKLLDEQQYWTLKRDKIPERKILEGLLSKEKIDAYEKERLRCIEVFDYLKEDKLQPEIIRTIKQWKKKHDIYLVTIRKKRETLILQLEHFGLLTLFNHVFSEDDNVGDWTVKARLLKDEIRNPHDCVIIGDTEADIDAGKNLGIKTIAVTCGIRSYEFLASLQPDYIYEYGKDVRIEMLLTQ